MPRRTAVTCDVLVIGAGPAGIAASVTSAECGSSVLLVDDNPLPGGQIWRAKAGETNQNRTAGTIADRWLGRVYACGAVRLLSTRAVARLAAESVLVEREHEAAEISFRKLILATGARELLLPFPGWTLPNVLAAGGLQALVKSGFPVNGKRTVVAGTGPLLLAVAAFLKSKGAHIAGIYEQCSWRNEAAFGASLLTRPTLLREAFGYLAALAGVPFRCGWWPILAEGRDAVRSITLTNGSRPKTIACDLVACGFHLVPNTELQSAFGCEFEDGRVKVDKWQRTSVGNVFSVGESTGIRGLDQALVEGQIAGLAAAGRQDSAPEALFRKREKLAGIARKMDRAFALRPQLRALPQPDTIICRCEDVPWSEVHRQRSFRSAKLHTRCGMGACQGRICGAALRFLTDWTDESVRPPIYPVRLSTLMGAPQAFTKSEKP